MRFYDPQQGSIEIGDKNIQNINTQDLRHMFAYVIQDTVLFHDSIFNNLKIAKIEITYPNKPDILNVTEINNNGESFEGINKKLPSGLYLVVFHFFIDNGNDTIKVIKSVYVE